MKIFRKSVTLLCALALILSLVPCAFAAESTEIKPGDVDLKGGENTFDGNSVVEERIDIVPTDELPTQKIDNEFSVTGGDLTVGENGSITISERKPAGASNATVDVKDGKLTNSGEIEVNAKTNSGHQEEDATVHASDGIENSGTITAKGVQGNGADHKGDAFVTTEGDLVNNGTIEMEGDVTYVAAGLGEDGPISGPACNITNNGTINIVAGEDTESFGGMYASGKITNAEDATINVEGSYTLIQAENGIDNFGNITLTCSDGWGLEPSNKVKNYNTITLNYDGNESVYYGVNYVDENGKIVDTLLENWLEAYVGSEDVSLRTDYIPTKDGATFGGWELNGVKLDGNTISITEDGPMSLKAIWNAIVQQITGSDHSESDGKPVENIIQHVEVLKVLDADRREMEFEKEYIAVARTSFGRLVVLFSWEQMSQMDKGDHLFYIVLPDGAEVEYTLTIR